MTSESSLKSLKEVKKEHILKVLQKAGWDLSAASRILKVSPSVLKWHLRKYGIHLPKSGE